MNVTYSLARCAAPQPAESSGNGRGVAGLVPAGVLAGFGDLLLFLLGTPSQPAAAPTGDASGALEVETAAAVPVAVIQHGLGGQPARAGGEAPVVQPAGAGMALAAARAGDADAGDFQAPAIADAQDGWEAGQAVFQQAVEPDQGVPLFPAVSSMGPAEEGDGQGPTVGDRAMPVVGSATPVQVAETEATAPAVDSGEHAPSAGYGRERVSADESAGREQRMGMEPAAEAKAPAEPAAATAVASRPRKPEAAQPSPEQPERAREVGQGGEGAAPMKTRKAAWRAAADGPESRVGSVPERVDAAAPSPEARPAVVGEEAAPAVGEVRAAGRQAARSIRTSEIASEIVQHGRLLKYPERTEVEIRLKPEWMGRVTLKVASQEGRISARFIVAESGVKAEIESRLGELRHEMSEQGLDIGEISVSLDGGRQWADHGGWTPAGGQAGAAWTMDAGPLDDGGPESPGVAVEWRHPAWVGTLDVMA